MNSYLSAAVADQQSKQIAVAAEDHRRDSSGAKHARRRRSRIAAFLKDVAAASL
jgi:hypothetical protein